MVAISVRIYLFSRLRMKKENLKGKGKCDPYFVYHMELLFLILQPFEYNCSWRLPRSER